MPVKEIYIYYIYIYTVYALASPAPGPPHPTYGIPSYATTHYIMGVDKSGNCPVPPCGVDMVLGWFMMYIYIYVYSYVM